MSKEYYKKKIIDLRADIAKEKEAKRLEKELRKKQRKEEKNPAKEIESTVEIVEETAFSEAIEETPTPAKEKKKKGFFRKK